MRVSGPRSTPPEILFAKKSKIVDTYPCFGSGLQVSGATESSASARAIGILRSRRNWFAHSSTEDTPHLAKFSMRSSIMR